MDRFKSKSILTRPLYTVIRTFQNEKKKSYSHKDSFTYIHVRLLPPASISLFVLLSTVADTSPVLSLSLTLDGLL